MKNRRLLKKLMVTSALVLSMSPSLWAKEFHVPSTVSPEAQAIISSFTDPYDTYPFPAADDYYFWSLINQWIEEGGVEENENVIASCSSEISVEKTTIGGIPVVDIKPHNGANSKMAIFLHGGAHTMRSAYSTCVESVPLAQALNLRLISVNYTLAPHAKFDAITDEVIAVVRGLLNEGYSMNDIAFIGASSGGGLAAGVTLKMRDLGMELPAALTLISPWLDLTNSGDTRYTLANNEVIGVYENRLENAAYAYADTGNLKHPYASPVYGDFSEEFPPTLIQGGTKEILLSDFVRFYQALDQAGHEVKLDIYDGMWHGFQIQYDIPESRTAKGKIKKFLRQKINYSFLG